MHLGTHALYELTGSFVFGGVPHRSPFPRRGRAIGVACGHPPAVAALPRPPFAKRRGLVDEGFFGSSRDVVGV